MLNVNTLPNRKDEEIMFDECYSQLRFRSKRTEEGRQKYFKTNVLVPREEGATVAATPTFSQYSGPLRCSFCGQDGQRLHGNNFTGRPHKIPQMSYLRYETKRRRFSDIHLH